MRDGRKSGTALIAAVCAGILYPLFLVVSTLFVVPVSLLQKAFASRTDLTLDRRAVLVHRTRWFVFVDVVATVMTYLVADIVRCEVASRSWPEVVPGYGPTLWIHLAMLAALVAGWPSILYWLGWYRPRARAWKWRLKNTAMGAVALAFFMSTIALILFREIYPRMQIGLTVAFLPMITGAVRIGVEWIERVGRRNSERRSMIDLVW